MEKIISDRFIVEDVFIAKPMFAYIEQLDMNNEYEKTIKELLEELGERNYYWQVTDRISGNSIPITDEEEAELLCALLNELPESFLTPYFGDSDVYTDDTLEEEFTIFEI